MFNLSGSEIIFLVVIALVVLGPDKLPEAMRKAGKAYAEFKKMSTGFQSEMRSVIDEPLRELRETAEMAKQSAMFDVKPFTDSIKDLGASITKSPSVAATAAVASSTPTPAPGPTPDPTPPPTPTATVDDADGHSARPPRSAPADMPELVLDEPVLAPVAETFAMWPTEPESASDREGAE